MAEISKEQFANWREHPITKLVMQEIEIERERLFSLIGAGGTINFESADGTQANTCMRIGNIQGLQFVLDMKLAEEEYESIGE